MQILIRCLLCFTLSFSLTTTPLVRATTPQMISTQDFLNQSAKSQKVIDFLKQDEVKNHLLRLGVSPEEAQMRVASLSQEELEKLNKEIQKATAGGEVIGLLTVVLLVVLIIYFVKRI